MTKPKGCLPNVPWVRYVLIHAGKGAIGFSEYTFRRQVTDQSAALRRAQHCGTNAEPTTGRESSVRLVQRTREPMQDGCSNRPSSSNRLNRLACSLAAVNRDDPTTCLGARR